MSEGLSLGAEAAQVGVGPRTLFTWQNKHEEFRQAIQEGRQRALLFWERKAIAMADGAPGNAQRLEHTGTDGGPVQVQPVVAQIDATKLTQEQRDALRAAILAAKVA